MKHVLVICGTRPEAIKLAPVVQALRARPQRAQVRLCATAQHRALLDAALEAFDLRPDLDLDLMRPDQHPAEVAGRVLTRLPGVLRELRPDVLVVQGDTVTVMAAALCGFLCGVPVAHVEAGLRTADRRRPFPEELSRRVAGLAAEWHFAPTPGAAAALAREGVPAQRVFVTGNTVVDALEWMRRRVADRPLPAELDPGDRRLVLVTAHRRESFGAALEGICRALRRIAAECPDAVLVYPVHPNPAVRRVVRQELDGAARVRLTDPLPYPLFVQLMLRAWIVLTDSGGIQEEAPALGVPVLVLRDVTERPEALASGVVRLIGTDPARLADEALRLLHDPQARAAMARAVPVYGDGRAAERIAQVLLDGHMTTPPFVPPV